MYKCAVHPPGGRPNRLDQSIPVNLSREGPPYCLPTAHGPRMLRRPCADNGCNANACDPFRRAPRGLHQTHFRRTLALSPFLQIAVRGARTRGSRNCPAVLPADCANRRRSAQDARVNSSTDRGSLNAPARVGNVHIHVIVALRDRRTICRFWYFRHRWKLRRGEPTGRPLASDGHFESGRSARSSSPVCLLRKGTLPHVLLKSAKASECTQDLGCANGPCGKNRRLGIRPGSIPTLAGQ